MAVAADIDEETVESCMDTDDVKGALVAMILEQLVKRGSVNPVRTREGEGGGGALGVREQGEAGGGGEGMEGEEEEEEEGLSEAEITAFKQKHADTLYTCREKAERLARLQQLCTQEWASYRCRCGEPGCAAVELTLGSRAG